MISGVQNQLKYLVQCILITIVNHIIKGFKFMDKYVFLNFIIYGFQI